jgi:Mor family transcriptional regulator
MLGEVITSATFSAAVSGLLIWLTKSWISERLKNAIKNEYDQKLETHKAQLKAQSDVEIEKLRSQLSILTTEHEVRFSRLHDKRAEVIAETYALLKELFVSLGEYVKIFEPVGDVPKEERRNAFMEAHKNFRSYYITRVIFFPKPTAIKLEEIDSQIVKNFNEFVFGVEMVNKRSDPTKKWLEIFDRVKGEIKTALSDLEDEFRRLLGDEN